MKIRERYRMMKRYGLTTEYLARKFGKHSRSIRRVISLEQVDGDWVTECRRFITERIDGVAHDEFWALDEEGPMEIQNSGGD